ncbi:MAG: hypothetical protein OEL75_01180, partial [Kiritimatiellaceae bacterium]|nr:hypothetical protein [Kiritimatiellaceae bacterium]
MKNVILRNGIYYFRKAVPEDCREALKKREFLESLGTKDPIEAKIAADLVRRRCEAEIKRVRSAKKKPAKKKASRLKVPDKSLDEELADFKDLLMSRADVSLPVIFEAETVDELKERAEHYLECINCLGAPALSALDLPEIGIEEWPPKDMATKNQRLLRTMDRILVDALEHMRIAIFEEIGEPISAVASQVPEKKVAAKPKTSVPKSESDQNANIDHVVHLMLASKTRTDKSKAGILADVELFKGWMGKKRDMREFTKADLISFATECLQY